MSWSPPAPGPPPAGWWTELKWDAAVAATLAERDAGREAKWALPAAVARAGRYLRDIDEALYGAAVFDEASARYIRSGGLLEGSPRPPEDTRPLVYDDGRGRWYREGSSRGHYVVP
jgi:hypothetical protein